MRHLIYCLTLTLLATPTVVKAQGRVAAVGVQTVEMRELAETVPLFAEVVTARDGAVANRVAGNIDTVHVLAGMRVEKGDLLVELNQELLSILVTQSQAQLAEAEAGVVTAETRLDRTTTAFSRVEALQGSNAISQVRVDDAQSAMLEAQSQLAEAQARKQTAGARLAEAKYRLDRSKITAPFSGVVLEVNAIPGAYIQAGSPVVRLLDTDALEIEASVAARYIQGMSPGQIVQATTETGTELALELRAILPLEDPSTRTRAVRFAGVDANSLQDLAVGQSITVQVPVSAAREVLSVPKDALVQARGGWTVFVAAEGKAEPRPVEIGVPLGDRYEVLNGLAAGDLVVVRGNERLRPGQEIAANPIEAN